MLFTLDGVAPIIKITPKENYNPWMNKNNELNNKRKEIRYLFGWAKRINTKDAWDLYHLRRSDYYHWVQKAKRESIRRSSLKMWKMMLNSGQK